MSYQISEGLYCGYSSANISCVWENCQEFFHNLSLVVTCLDSTEKVSSSPHVKKRIAEDGLQLTLVGTDSIYVPHQEISRFVEDPRMLSHFDEIYLVSCQ